jgi:hypothetical protein
VLLAGAADTPSFIRANYDLMVSSGFKIATVSETYSRVGSHYRIESISHAIGLAALIKHETIHVISEGMVTPQGLQPITYTQQRDVDKEKNSSTQFNWEQALLMLNDQDGKRSLPLSAGTQDRLSTMYQFQFIPLRDAHEVKLNMTDGNKVEAYTYTVTQEKTVVVPFGICPAHYLVTTPQPDGWQSEIWLRTQDRLPCKVILTDSNGDRYIQVLTGLSIEP